MQFKRVEITDREKILSYCTLKNTTGAHHSFTNMIIWGESYSVEFAEVDRCLCLRGKHKRNNWYYFFPIGDGDRGGALKKIVDYARATEEKCVFAHLTPEEARALQGGFPNMFEITENRNAAEYVYQTQKLISLSGKQLHGKRNHLNSFLRRYPFLYEPINEQNIAAAKHFALDSLEGREDAQEEEISIIKLFGNFFTLGLSGAVLWVEDKIAAVTAGEMLMENMAVVHLEKADTLYDGSYAAINNLFLKHRFSEVEYVNREEDMGIEGLRRAKLSYKPAFMIPKLTAVQI